MDPGIEHSLQATKTWITRNRDSLTVGVLVLVASTGVAVLIQGGDPTWVVILANLAMIGILALHRATVGAAVSRMRDIVVHELGVPWVETQYSRRKKHFFEEKELLASVFVEDVLPSLCERIEQDIQQPDIRVILDSGTTITPIFQHLVRKGIQSPGGKTFAAKFYTNNLAGIDEVQKLDHLRDKKLNEDDFTLIGGTPLSRYRATTGELTQKTLDDLFAEQQKEQGKIITVGVLTANWLLSGRGYDWIVLCARGRGHPEFKECVSAGTKYLVVIAPLGKILRLDNVEALNELLPAQEHLIAAERPEYRPIEIHQKETTFLLTSRRPSGSNSPLRIMSNQLFEMEPAVLKNFVLHQACPEYAPFGTEVQVCAIEMPHIWTRAHSSRLFAAG